MEPLDKPRAQIFILDKCVSLIDTAQCAQLSVISLELYVHAKRALRPNLGVNLCSQNTYEYYKCLAFNRFLGRQANV